MLILMKVNATEAEIQGACHRVEELGYRPHPLPGATRCAIGITGNKGAVEADSLSQLPGVAEVIAVSKPYKLVSRDMKPEDTVIRFANSAATIGGPELAMMAGPCGVESRDQLFRSRRGRSQERCALPSRRSLQAAHLALRLPGPGRRRACDCWREARAAFGLPVVTEAHRSRTSPRRRRAVRRHDPDGRPQHAELRPAQARRAAATARAAQARHGRHPRGAAMAAEYIMSEGNLQRHPLRARHPHLRDDHPRNTLDVEPHSRRPSDSLTCPSSPIPPTPPDGAITSHRSPAPPSPPAPTASSSRCIAIPTVRSAMAPSRSDPRAV